MKSIWIARATVVGPVTADDLHHDLALFGPVGDRCAEAGVAGGVELDELAGLGGDADDGAAGGDGQPGEVARAFQSVLQVIGQLGGTLSAGAYAGMETRDRW